MARSAFISYRRDDAEGEAGRLHDRLERRLGRKNVFWDRDDVGPADNFEDRIADRISEADVVLAVVGPDWASSTNLERLANPEDWVRRELESGLRSASTRLAIALVAGAQWPPSGALPHPLDSMRSINAWSLRSDQFERDVDYMADKLKLRDRRRVFAMWGLGAIVALVLTAAALFLVDGDSTPTTSSLPIAAMTTTSEAGSGVGTTKPASTTTIKSALTTTTQPDVRVPVPGTATLTEAAAMALLERAGFEVDVQEKVSGTLTPGRAIRSDPAEGSLEQPGSTVKLYISSGPSPHCSTLAPGATIVVGLDSSSRYTEVQEDGTIDGFEPALLDAVLLQLCGQRQFVFSFMTAESRFTALVSGQVDVALTFTRFQESVGVIYSTPYVLVEAGTPKVLAILGNPDLRADIDAALVEVIVSGHWLALHEEWLGTPGYTVEDMLATPLPDP